MSSYSIKAAKEKLAEKQNLLKSAKKKLREAEALVSKAEEEVKSAEQEYDLQVDIQINQQVQETIAILSKTEETLDQKRKNSVENSPKHGTVV